MSKRGAAPCWLYECEAPGREGRVTYRERGGEIPLTLCDEHARAVQSALADRRLRWGVLVTSHEPSRVIVEEPRRPHTGKYRATYISYPTTYWPSVILRRSLHSPETRSYVPSEPFLFPLHDDVGVKYELLEVSADEKAATEGDYERGADYSWWPKSLLVERVLGGYTDRQVYVPEHPSESLDWR